MPNKIDHVYPYLRVKDAPAAMRFYKDAFGAELLFELVEPGGRVGHSELKFGDFIVMLSDEYPEYGIHAPQTPGAGGTGIHLHVADVDAMTNTAVELGATLVMPPRDMFYGERASKVIDPFGHEWLLGSPIEDVSPEEMQRRFTEMCHEGADLTEPDA